MKLMRSLVSTVAYFLFTVMTIQGVVTFALAAPKRCFEEILDFPPRRTSDNPKIDVDRLLWYSDQTPEPGLRVVVTRKPGLVTYRFTKTGKSREVTIRVPQEYELDFLPAKESFRIPAELGPAKSRIWDKDGHVTSWRLNELTQIAASKLYRASGENADARLDPIIEHLFYEQERYMTLLRLHQTEKLDFRLLLPIERRPFPGYFTENASFDFGLSTFPDTYGVYVETKNGFQFDPIQLMTDAARVAHVGQHTFGESVFGLHVDESDGTSYVLDIVIGAKLGSYEDQMQLPTAIWRFSRDVYWKELAPSYQEKGLLGLLETRINNAFKISQDKDILARSFLFAWMGPENSFVQSRFSRDVLNSPMNPTREMPPNSHPTDVIPRGRSLPFDTRSPEEMAKSIDAALTAVVSANPKEPLPVELLFNVCLPRDGKKMIEVGRRAQAESGRVKMATSKLVKMLVAWAGGSSDIGRVIVHADDESHVRLHRLMKCKPIDPSLIRPCDWKEHRERLGLGDAGDLTSSGGAILECDIDDLMRQQKLIK